jgi:hypothetical protein
VDHVGENGPLSKLHKPPSDASEQWDAAATLLLVASSQPALARSRLSITKLLWQNRRYLLKIVALGLVGSTIVTFLVLKMYRSTTTLMPPHTHSMLGMALAALAPEANDTLSTYANSMLGLWSAACQYSAQPHSSGRNQLQLWFRHVAADHAVLEGGARE